MQIIIPMSGFGERFYKAGYTIPKSLIELEGKSIIAHVIDMFPGELNFIFICNQDHLEHDSYKMKEILQKYCPTGRILGIPPHKLGPVHAVMQVRDLIDLNQPALINYCDFTCYWDWSDFKSFVKTTNCDGAIPAYKGFHPHSLGQTNYAYMQENNGWVKDIQEKQPYTDNRMNEFASSGSYYFASGKILIDALSKTIEQKLTVGGEYYLSLAYKPLLDLNYSIAVYPIQHFMQWGTPEDVAEYKYWSSIFRQLINISPKKFISDDSALIIPMAGLGARFIQEGYQYTKPLIPVSGKPMAIQAIDYLPNASHRMFVIREDMADFEALSRNLLSYYPEGIIKTIPKLSKGQASTALAGLDELEKSKKFNGPVTFSACDNGVIYNQDFFESLIKNSEIDIIVWGARQHYHAARNPQMYGWIQEDKGKISKISVKKPLQNPSNDPIVIGSFTFRRADDFRSALARLIARDGQINGEFYIDECINDAIALGLNCHFFEVDHFISWGTPNDLRTYEYWQSCFHKWISHPYRLELDSYISAESLVGLDEKYAAVIPERPKHL